MAVNINVRWADNTKELAAALRAGTTEINATKQSVERMVAALSGDKLIASAHKTTAAINTVGVSLLSAAEAARHLATLEKAMEKLSLASKPIPEDMARTAAQLRDVVAAANSAEKGWASFVKGFKVEDAIANPLATAKQGVLAFSETLGPAGVAAAAAAASITAAGIAIFGLAQKAASVGAELDDMADKTGMSVPALSRLSNAAQVLGTDLGSLTNAVFMLEKNMGEGGDKFVEGLKAMGLTTEQLKAAGPDRYLELVAQGLRNIEDPSARAAAGNAVLGRSYRDLAATLQDLPDAFALVQDITPWTAEQAAAAEKFEMQLKSLKVHAEALGLSLGRELIPYVSAFVSAGVDVASFIVPLAGKLSGLTGMLNLMGDGWSTAAAALRQFKHEAETITIPKPPQGYTDWLKHVADLGKAPSSLNDVPAIIRDLNEQMRDGSKSARDHEAALKRAAAEAQHLANEAKQLQAAFDRFTHETVMDSIKSLKEWGDEGRRQLHAQIDDFIKTNEAAEKLRNTLRALQRDDFAGVAHGLENVGTKVPILSDAQKRAIEATKATSAWADGLGVAAQSMYDLGQISGGTFGAILQGSASMLGAMQQVVSVMGKANVSAAELTQSYLNLTFAAYQFVDAILKEREAARIRLDQEHALFELYKKYPGIAKETAEAIRNASISPSGLVSPTEVEEALHLAQIIRDLGGFAAITGPQIDLVRQNLALLFQVATTPGAVTQREAMAQIDAVLADMGANAVKSNGLVSQLFLDMVRNARAAGIELEKVNAFLLEQTKTNIVGGLGAFVTGGKDAAKNLDDVRKQMAAIKDERDDLLRRGSLGTSDAKRLDELNKQWADLQAKATTAEKIIAAGAVTSQSAATALGASVMAAFEEMRRQGVPISEIMAQLGPIIDELGKKFDAAGFSGGAAFDAVRDMAALAKDEFAGPVIDGVNGLGKALMGLHNIGALDADTFLGLTRQIKDGYNALAAQGKGGVAALRLMQPALQTIWALHKDTGMAIDAETQALLDEAEANGIVGDKMRPIQEQQLLATQRIADAVEALAEVFGVLPKAAKEAADGISDGLSKIKIPKIKIPIEYDLGSLPDGTIPTIPGTPAPPRPLGSSPLDGVPRWAFSGLSTPITAAAWMPSGATSTAVVPTASGRQVVVNLGGVNVVAPPGSTLSDMEAFAPAFREGLRLDTGLMRTTLEGVVEKKVRDLL